MIRVQCPHCQRRYRTEMEAFGRTAVCTRCSQTFKIGEARPPFQWKTTDLAEDSWIGVPAPEEAKVAMKHCIICDAPLRPDMMRCPECGANQVTGLVHKSHHREGVEEAPPIWSVIPVRMILIVLGLIIVGGGVYWGAKALGRRGVQLSDELADTNMVARLAKQLDNGEDEAEIAGKYSGYVKDANIERFAQMLTVGAQGRRRAAALLIGAGQQTNITPVVTAAASQDSSTASAGMAALEAMGPRRIIELSNTGDEKTRLTAADALILLFDLDRRSPKAAQLSRSMPVPEKIKLLNDLCRPWPELVGPFAVVINDTPSPFVVNVEQVGKMFFLKVNGVEFVSARNAKQFTIPIHRWCMATGSAVDGRSVRDLMDGSVSILSRVGAFWEGDVAVAAHRLINPPMPGFLPFDAPDPGKETGAKLKLERPARR